MIEKAPNVIPLPADKRTYKTGKRYKAPVRCFAPRGRTSYVIYVVCLKEHPGVVKIGRTTKWRGRRREYANWNLAAGDAIDREKVFILTDEFVSLEHLEKAILDQIPYPRRHGKEWFVADFDDVCRLIDQFLCVHDVSYLIEGED